MFDRSKILIGVPGTYNYPNSKNWIECESTWIPLLRDKGYDVLILLSDESQIENYKIRGNFFITKNSDLKDGLYYKNYFHISDYVLISDRYDYYFKIDSDSFVHPERFDRMLQSLIEMDETPDYLGCCCPARGWDTRTPCFEKIDEGHGFASGAAMMLSRKALEILKRDFNPDIHLDLHFDDLLVGNILRPHLPLYHDSRILMYSKYNMAEIVDLHDTGPAFITEEDSHLAIQHYCDGHMNEIISDIYK